MRLPADALLGEPNKGFYYLMNELPQVRRTPLLVLLHTVDASTYRVDVV